MPAFNPVDPTSDLANLAELVLEVKTLRARVTVLEAQHVRRTYAQRCLITAFTSGQDNCQVTTRSGTVVNGVRFPWGYVPAIGYYGYVVFSPDGAWIVLEDSKTTA